MNYLGLNEFINIIRSKQKKSTYFYRHNKFCKQLKAHDYLLGLHPFFCPLLNRAHKAQLQALACGLPRRCLLRSSNYQASQQLRLHPASANASSFHRPAAVKKFIIFITGFYKFVDFLSVLMISEWVDWYSTDCFPDRCNSGRKKFQFLIENLSKLLSCMDLIVMELIEMRKCKDLQISMGH